MTDLFPSAVAIVVGVEGRYSKSASDRGNWTGGKIGLGELRGTKYGISAAAYPMISDIANLTLDQAHAIYHRDYWLACHCDVLQWMLALGVFDDAVNSGAGAAARRLQRALGVVADGAIGPLTLAALPASESKAVITVFLKLMFERAAAYAADQNAATYLAGWLNRLVDITEAALLAPEEVGTV
jgi:lysozyme family protein